MPSLPPISSVDLGHLSTKSARIRILKDLGYRQADIARHLGIRDQHVSNVVRGPRPRADAVTSLGGMREAGRAFAPVASALRPERLVVGSDGTVRLPSSWRVAGAAFIARKLGSSIVLMDVRDASAAARGTESAVDQLIAERRLEAMREFDD